MKSIVPTIENTAKEKDTKAMVFMKLEEVWWTYTAHKDHAMTAAV